MGENRLERRVFEAFHDLFESNLPSCRFSHRETFEKTNNEFSPRFQLFTSYEGFKTAKSRHFKAKKLLKKRGYT